MTLKLPRFGDWPEMPRSWTQFFYQLAAELGFAESDVYRDLAVTEFPELAKSAVNGNFDAPLLVDGSTTLASFLLRMPRDFKPQAAVTPFVEWAPVDAGAGTAVFQFEYKVLSEGSSIGALTALEVEADTESVAYERFKTDFASFGNETLQPDDIVLCTISRLGADADDDYGSSVVLLGAGLTYPVQGLGSRSA